MKKFVNSNSRSTSLCTVKPYIKNLLNSKMDIQPALWGHSL